MIVNLTTLDQDQAIEQISQLEPQLFGTSAWSPNAIRQENGSMCALFIMQKQL